MSFKKNSLFYLAFIPPLFLSVDFLPMWFIYQLTTLSLFLSIINIPKVFAYFNFFSIYFIFKTVGFALTPETAIPILSIFIFSQMILTKKKNSKEYYLLFLFLGALSVFNTSLYYFIYSIFSLFLLIYIQSDQAQNSPKEIIKNLWEYKLHLFFGSLLVVILFLFFPRYYGFFPSTPQSQQGKIGYAKTIQNDQISQLNLTDKTVFYAETESKIPAELLYWRGRTMNKTDGYNWEQSKLKFQNYKRVIKGNPIEYQIHYEESFNGDVILLDLPTSVETLKSKIYEEREFGHYKTFHKNKKIVYKAVSRLSSYLELKGSTNQLSPYLSIPKYLPQNFKTLSTSIKSKSPEDIILDFSKFLREKKFLYTLSPGALPTLKDFLNEKKGFCTHYASLLGILLRHKGIPARIISGFQGGKYNDLGNYYEIKSKDAHAWVEYFSQNRWKRVDPTGFIAEDRIKFGGEFLTLSETERQDGQNQNKNIISKVYTQIARRIAFLNYKFSVLLENFNREEQRSLTRALGLRAKTMFAIGALLFIFILSLFYFLKIYKPKPKIHPADRILKTLEKKLKIRDQKLLLAPTISDKQKLLEQYITQNWIFDFLNYYQEFRYGKIDRNSEMEAILKDNLL